MFHIEIYSIKCQIIIQFQWTWYRQLPKKSKARTKVYSVDLSPTVWSLFSNSTLFLAPIWKFNWAHFNLTVQSNDIAWKIERAPQPKVGGQFCSPILGWGPSQFHTLFRASQPNLKVRLNAAQLTFRLGWEIGWNCWRDSRQLGWDQPNRL